MSPFRRSHRLFMVALLHLMRVRTRRILFLHISIIALGAGALLLAGCDKGPSATGNGVTTYGDTHSDDGGDDSASHGTPRPCAGSYNVLIRGDYQGTGTATATATSVQITAQVKDATGATGTFSFSGTLVNQRFSGNGSVMDAAASVSGRLDPADITGSRGSVLNSNRLVATISTSAGHFARIAGQ